MNRWRQKQNVISIQEYFKEMRDMTAHLTQVEASENQRSTSFSNRTGTILAINLEKEQN